MEGSRDREKDGDGERKVKMGMVREMGDKNEREVWRERWREVGRR
jgi:hypothetical protein